MDTSIGVDQLSFPSKTFRGSGALNSLGGFCKTQGGRAFILGGKTALSKTVDKIHSNLGEAGIEVVATEWYGGKCSMSNISNLVDQVIKNKADVILAVGGGKALDTGKAVAAECGLPIITIPTIAATCAAATPLTVLYNDEGEFARNLFFKDCPVGIVIDTSIILDTPVTWLAAGMGDTLAKMYELRAASSRMQPTSMTISAVINGQICYDIIQRFGSEAVNAIESQTTCNEFDSTIDAIILFAGLSSIFGGNTLRNAAAHAIYNGFTKIPAAHKVPHGLIVGYGNLCLLALEGRSDEEILEEIKLAKRCAIPTTLGQIAVLSETELRIVAEASAKTTAMACMPFSVSGDMVIAAMLRVNQLAAK